jgi:hypothetical protein
MALLADIDFVPELFLSYQQEINQAQSAFFRSGIIAQNDLITQAFATGGREIVIPFFDDLSGEDEVLSDVIGLTPAQIGSGRQTGVRNLRGRAWQSSDLAAELAGSDPMMAIAQRTGEYWVRRVQATLIAQLVGLFGAGGPLASSNAVGGTSTALTGAQIVKAIAKLGDSGKRLTAIAMHSAPYYYLVEQDLIIPAASPAIVPTSQLDTRISGEMLEMGTYGGRTVFVDDTLPVSIGTGTGGTNVYTSYLFGRGAFAYAEILPKQSVETDRNILKGIEVLVNRKEYLLHPVGMAFQGTVAGNSPTNTEFQNVSAYSQAFSDNRNIRMVALRSFIPN